MVKGSGALYNSHQINPYLEAHGTYSDLQLNHLLDNSEHLFFSLCREFRLGFQPVRKD